MVAVASPPCHCGRRVGVLDFKLWLWAEIQKVTWMGQSAAIDKMLGHVSCPQLLIRSSKSY